MFMSKKMGVMLLAVWVMSGAVSLAVGQTEVYVSTTGSDSGAGTQADPFATLNKALGVAGPGDVITMLPGVYRQGEIEIKQGGTKGKPMTIQGLPGAKTVLKGSKLVTGWKQGKTKGLWYVSDWPVDSQQLFVDGEPLQQIGVHNKFQIAGTTSHRKDAVLKSVGKDLSDVKPGTFFYDTGSKTLYAMLLNGADPNQHTMEASVKDYILITDRDKGADYVTLRNLTFMHSNGTAHGGHDGLVSVGRRGWTIVNCTFAYGDMVGLKLHGTDHIVRHCKIVFNGGVGIGLNGSLRRGGGYVPDREPMNILIEDCSLSYNNYRTFNKYWGAAAIKLMPSVRGVTIRDCLVMDNHNAKGIWFDTSLGSNRVENNFIWGNYQGIHIEKTIPAPGDEFSVLVRNNIVVDNAEQGIYLSAAEGTIVKNNTAYNNHWSIVVHGMPRTGTGAPKVMSHNVVINNIIGGRTLDTVLFVGEHAADNTLAGNFYVINSNHPNPKISLTKAGYSAGRIYTDLDKLRRETKFGDHAVAGDPQWFDPASGDFRLKPGSPAKGFGSLGDVAHPLKPSGEVLESSSPS